MKQGKIIGFNAAKMAEQMMANAVAEQNRRLVEYAEQRIIMLGETINSYNSKHYMDDTGNLLDSLCWGVCYNGEMVQSGFYRSPKANMPSYLHGWSNVEFADPKRFKKHAVVVSGWFSLQFLLPIGDIGKKDLISLRGLEATQRRRFYSLLLCLNSTILLNPT